MTIESTQPQLPPPEKDILLAIEEFEKHLNAIAILGSSIMGVRPMVANNVLCGIEELRRQLLSSIAENESLKAQLRDRDEHINCAYAALGEVNRSVYLFDHIQLLKAERDKAANKANQLRLAFVLSDTVLPAEFEPELPPTKRLHTYIDKMLEVVREYRNSHRNEVKSGLRAFSKTPCRTCIKADALLPKEPKEEV